MTGKIKAMVMQQEEDAMTDDKQIEAAFKEWFHSMATTQEQLPSLRDAWKAAINASHAKYVPELVAALKEVTESVEGWQANEN